MRGAEPFNCTQSAGPEPFGKLKTGVSQNRSFAVRQAHHDYQERIEIDFAGELMCGARQSRLDWLRRFTMSLPRKREPSGLKFGLIAPIFDFSSPLDQDCGRYGGLDSRLRGNDGLLGGDLG